MIAAPMPIGAYIITSPTIRNTTSATLSKNPSMTTRRSAVTRVSAMANRIANTTTCRTSLLAAASTMLCGTMCSSTAPTEVWCAAKSVPVVADAWDNDTPVPGCSRFPARSPTTSANVVTASK